MLLLLTGDIQIGKTSWLLKTVARLEEGGVAVEGVVAPGVWVPVRAGEPGFENASAGLGVASSGSAPADGSVCRYDKRGIDNLLLPEHETIPFARREDLARAEGTYDASNQAARVGMTWHIDDRAVARVNAHFDRLAAAADEAVGRADESHRPRVLIVDELGRLELLHDGGLTSAMALLAQGPRGYYDHAVVVARDLFGLSERVEELFADVWGGSVRIPHDERAWQRWFAPLCAMPANATGRAPIEVDAQTRAAQGRLRTILAEIPSDPAAGTGGLVVAFSGGVDSTFLLASAAEVPGLRLLAVSAASPAFPERELGEARAFCAEHGIAHEVVASPELDVPGYRDNPPDRCYLCKKGLFGELSAFARARGYAALADGTNVDDEGDYRPGMRALAELGVRSPLREAGLHKEQIRALSREMGLPTWNKPSFACLSSRFAYGERITEERLAMVDAAEQYLLDLGLTQVRVRIHGAQAPIARIEVLPQEFDRVARTSVREQVDERLRALGFGYVALDLRGYRSGSMNAALSKA